MSVFDAIWERFKDDFGTIWGACGRPFFDFGGSWGRHGADVSPPVGQEGSKRASETDFGGFWLHFGSILAPFWEVLGTIFDGFSDNLGR